MRFPTAIDDGETYWLRSRDVSDDPTVASDEYYSLHDVLDPEKTTDDDRPAADNEAVRALDREALEQAKLIGKWQVTGSAERIDDLWPELVADAEAGHLWAAKAMTTFGYRELPYDQYLIAVYTPNYFDREDVFRVRKRLRTEHAVTHELYYKPDLYTAKGIVAETPGEFRLSKPARYVG